MVHGDCVVPLSVNFGADDLQNNQEGGIVILGNLDCIDVEGGVVEAASEGIELPDVNAILGTPAVCDVAPSTDELCNGRDDDCTTVWSMKVS